MTAASLIHEWEFRQPSSATGGSMTIPDPVRALTRPIPVRTWLLVGSLFVFVCFSFALLAMVVAPSLDGHTNMHIAADSGAYMSLADGLRDARTAPAIAAVIFFTPNTLLMPVLLALALKSVFAIAIANYALLFVAICLLKRAFRFSTGAFVGLLLINATTIISLISVNKEIVDLVAVSMFLFGYQRRRRGVLLLSLALALLNRFEICVVMVVFLIAVSRLNPQRARRGTSLIVLILALSIALPMLAPGTLSERFGDVQGGFIASGLDYLEVHYLYIIALVPKVAQNLLGSLVNIPVELNYLRDGDIANSVVLFSNNLADAIVLLVIWRRRMFRLREGLIYFAAMGSIITAVSPLIQVRYFYFVYVVLCLQAAMVKDEASVRCIPGREGEPLNPVQGRVLTVG
jgi:hypothetical protein